MDIYQAIKKRKSIRSYRPERVKEEKLQRILEAGRLAPSAKNIQAWRFIVTREQELKERLVEACRGQKFIAGADCILTVCVDKSAAYQHHGGYMTSFAVDGAIAMEHMILAAAAEGLGTCWIGAYDEDKVRAVLGVPESFRIIGLTPLGYPAVEGKDRGRKPLEEIVCREVWE